jgi:F420-dependent oxidoreductase-like protein
MDLGVHVVRFDLPDGPAAIAPTLAEVGRLSEQGGLTNISVMDHWFQMEAIGGPHLAMLEGYTTLGYLAAHTSTVDLQLLVTGVTYRHPGLLAKIASTLDVLSGGRAVLGLGAAWYEREHLGLGVPFPPLAERFERLEETLQILRQMWSEDDGPYEGTHYRLAETINLPQPLRPVPVMIGGSGERKTLRLVATYADASNIFARPGADGVAAFAAKLDVLREHCERVGRPYDEIRKTALYVGSLDPTTAAGTAGFLDDMTAYAAIGVTEVHVMPPGDPVPYVAGLAERVVPELSAL